MSAPDEQTSDFPHIKARLDDIAERVDDESLTLDEVLKLYEEAVSLGLEASSLLEQEVLDSAEEASTDTVDSDQTTEA